MRIAANHAGGNVVVREIDGDLVRLAPDLRDTDDDWFYWNFRVEGAQGRTLTFDFSPKAWVGWHGAAVSADNERWRWTHTASDDGCRFTYAFGPDEDCAYFCHDMYYSLERFNRFAERLGLDVAPLARTRKGRETPCARVGRGEKWILLTSRHHCCESTGTYLMEGAVERYLESPIPGYRLMCVPFVDLDGVLDGDQGKNRAPHDHNRDYEPPEQGGEIYPETAAIKRWMAAHDVRYLFDLHSPWHRGGRDDQAFCVGGRAEDTARMHAFSRCLQRAVQANPASLKFDGSGDIEAGVEWNSEDTAISRSSTRYASRQAGMIYSQSFETTYFGTTDNVVTQEKLVALGRSFLEAVRAFMQEEGHYAAGE